MKLKCPRCLSILNSVSVESHYGKKIVVDQCPNCGGIWFDPHEYYQVADHDVDKLDSVNINLAQQQSILKENYLCPKDNVIMAKFSDISLPKNVDIEQCGVCGGFWFEKGELRKTREKEKMSDTMRTAIDKTLAMHSEKDKSSFITDLSQSLMRPYYYTGSKSGTYPDQFVDFTVSAVSTILRAMLPF